MSDALAYVNWGRWLADCPAPGCFDARLVMPGDVSMTCVAGHTSPLLWPGDLAAVSDITSALNQRPAAKTRNWFPEGHPIAEILNAPMGQTPADLIAEADAEAQAASEQRSQMVGIATLIAGAGPVTLDDLGLAIADDGTLVPTPTPEPAPDPTPDPIVDPAITPPTRG